MINKVILGGNVGKDPEIRKTQSGDAVAKFSLATTKRWKDRSGERQSVTIWHRVVVLNHSLAEVVEKYVKKGSRVYIEGEIAERKYTKDGEERTVYEIVLAPFHAQLVLLDRAEKHVSDESDYVPSGGGSASEPPDDQVPF